MLFIRKYLKVLYIIALPIYFYISYSSILNKHSHVNASGIVLTHSHPVSQENDQPIGKHNHSKREIYLFQILNFDDFNITEAINIEMIDWYFVGDLPQQSGTNYYELDIGFSSPRAPPAFSFKAP